MRKPAPILALLCGLLAAAPAAAQDQPPNILVLIADDANWSDFGVYGNDAVRSPNVDRLATSGLRVRHAFVTTSQCSPSRISMLTGRYPHATGAEDLHMPVPEGTVILPGLLKQAGYFTGSMKKTHYGEAVAERQFDWYDEHTASAFPAFLEAAGRRPFFLWVGFTEPHRPFPDDVRPFALNATSSSSTPTWSFPTAPPPTSAAARRSAASSPASGRGPSRRHRPGCSKRPAPASSSTTSPATPGRWRT